MTVTTQGHMGKEVKAMKKTGSRIDNFKIIGLSKQNLKWAF